jgi:hypothetical protein
MLFAVLEFSDFAIIAFLIVVLAGGRAAASAYLRPASENRLRQIEHGLDLILTHLGIDYVPPSKPEWQELADAGQKILAIKAYREKHSMGLAEAKKVIEDYIEGKSA